MISHFLGHHFSDTLLDLVKINCILLMKKSKRSTKYFVVLDDFCVVKSAWAGPSQLLALNATRYRGKKSDHYRCKMFTYENRMHGRNLRKAG